MIKNCCLCEGILGSIKQFYNKRKKLKNLGQFCQAIVA